MNLTEYIQLLNRPDTVQEKQTAVLERVVQEFPYFQSARALYLKGLYNQNSFKYNYVLKVTAAHTNDRSVLFDFITSDTFTSVNKSLFDDKMAEIAAIPVQESEVLTPGLDKRENSVEQSILSSIAQSGQDEINAMEVDATELVTETVEADPFVGADDFVAKPEVTETPAETPHAEVESIVAETPAEPTPEMVETVPEIATPDPEVSESIAESTEKLEIGKPLHFESGETHSFQEWLQLSQFKPIVREPEPIVETDASVSVETVLEVQQEESSSAAATEPETSATDESEKQKKNDLIDRFIEANPKIPKITADSVPANVIVEPSMPDNSFLMTETLARVYLEQKKYNRAIQAYEILILKYPEKSSFFADRILDIKNLQQNTPL